MLTICIVHNSIKHKYGQHGVIVAHVLCLQLYLISRIIEVDGFPVNAYFQSGSSCCTILVHTCSPIYWTD